MLPRLRAIGLAVIALSGIWAYLRGYQSISWLKTGLSTTSGAEWSDRRDEVKQAFVTSWNAHAEHAMGRMRSI